MKVTIATKSGSTFVITGRSPEQASSFVESFWKNLMPVVSADPSDPDKSIWKEPVWSFVRVDIGTNLLPNTVLIARDDISIIHASPDDADSISRA